MTNDGFTSFLMSSDNMAFSERQLRICDDMTRPLCEYYISSSHNVGDLASALNGIVSMVKADMCRDNLRRHTWWEVS